MAASCAACLRAILPRDEFALSGTEVFHRQCAPNIAQSIGTRQKLLIVELRQQLQAQRDQFDRAKIHNDNVVRNIRGELTRATNEASLADEYKRRWSTADRIGKSWQAEAERLRTDLALHQALEGSRTAHTPAPAAPPPKISAEPQPDLEKDNLDDAEQRFRLLELDPLK